MVKSGKRALALALTAAMAFSLAACGGKEQQQQGENKETIDQEGYVWAADYRELDPENSYYNMAASEDYIYCQAYNYDEKTETSSVSITSFSIADGSEGIKIEIPQGEQEEGFRGGRSISYLMLDTEGNLLTIEDTYGWNENTGENNRGYYICKYSAQGEKLLEQDISELLVKDEGNIWIQNAALDGENRLYVMCDTESSSLVYLFDAEGNHDGTVSLDSRGSVRDIGRGKDGKVYLSMYNMNGAGMSLNEIDYEGRKLGQSYDGFISNGNIGITEGLTKDFIGTDNTSVYEYDMASQSSEKLFDWLDSDIDGNTVQFLKPLSDGRLMVISTDWQTNTADMILLSKKPASEVPQKQQLVIGAMYSDSSIQSAVVKFNKSSDKYHISIKNYYDSNNVTSDNYQDVLNDATTRMNNDITSDSCPDMLCIENINLAKYAAKGVFEDLGGYMDKSSKLKRSDYFEKVLDAYTYDGVLVAVPKTFAMESMVGKVSDLGERNGWTLEEMIFYGEEHPDAELWGNVTKERALSMMTRFSQGSFVDWTTGTCSFDSGEFEQILELANRFPKDWQYDEDAPSLPKRLQEGEVLLDSIGLYNFNDIQVAAAMFGSEVTFIGYPNESGESGTYLQGYTGVAITSKCADKDGAWSFVEQWLSESDNNMYGFGFPSNKNEFAEQRAKETEVNYVLDENGEKALDENGEPIVQSTGGMSYGDWDYDYRPTTEEEADLLEKLIGIASPMDSSDEQITSIINEEAQAFFSGQKSAKDVAGIVQSRVQVYVNENS
ncbi:MAG: extracellular solute-binding protein [Butyrivibrio sp.]|nr:extracellular solute-binding protein [Muribaculum sp.]MCM1551540.1 extracellular solute-binding protein [Butyrivibrio sp.]